VGSVPGTPVTIVQSLRTSVAVSCDPAFGDAAASGTYTAVALQLFHNISGDYPNGYDPDTQPAYARFTGPTWSEVASMNGLPSVGGFSYGVHTDTHLTVSVSDFVVGGTSTIVSSTLSVPTTQYMYVLDYFSSTVLFETSAVLGAATVNATLGCAPSPSLTPTVSPSTSLSSTKSVTPSRSPTPSPSAARFSYFEFWGACDAFLDAAGNITDVQCWRPGSATVGHVNAGVDVLQNYTTTTNFSNYSPRSNYVMIAGSSLPPNWLVANTSAYYQRGPGWPTAFYGLAGIESNSVQLGLYAMVHLITCVPGTTIKFTTPVTADPLLRMETVGGVPASSTKFSRFTLTSFINCA